MEVIRTVMKNIPKCCKHGAIICSEFKRTRDRSLYHKLQRGTTVLYVNPGTVNNTERVKQVKG